MTVQIKLTGGDVATFTDEYAVKHELREGMVATVSDEWWEAQPASFKKMFLSSDSPEADEPTLSLRLAQPQNIPNNAWTNILWTGEDRDTHVMHSANAAEILIGDNAGLWDWSLSCAWDAATGTKVSGPVVNAAFVNELLFAHGAVQFHQHAALGVSLNPNVSLTFAVYQSSGAQRVLQAGTRLHLRRAADPFG